MRYSLYIIFVLFVCSSCSVQRYLPDGERLYRGADIVIEKDSLVKTGSGTLEDQLRSADRLRPNRFFLGHPYRVWWWYVLGEPRRPRGIKAFFRKRFGEPPVLSSAVNPGVTAANMRSLLDSRGYFQSSVTGDTLNEKYFAKAVYKATIKPQYTIQSITWVNDSSAVVQELQKAQRNGILRTGRPYRLSDLQAERDRLDGVLKQQGYFYFNPDYIMAYVDSTVGNRQVSIFLSLKSGTPENARHPFHIERVTVFPNYTLLLPPPDTSKQGTFVADGINIRDTVHKFQPRVFTEMITYRPGHLYNSREQNTTLNRLINLGSFKFVKNRYEQVRDSADPYRLNVFYYLTPARRKSLSTELDGFSKENKYLGMQLSLNWRNRNAFNDGSLLNGKVYGGFELSFSDSLATGNNYRLGAETYINFPRFVLPLFTIRDRNLYPARSRLLLGYEVFRKHLFYSKNIFRTQFEYHWKQSSNKEHNFAPLYLTHTNSYNLSDTFTKVATGDRRLLPNVYDEVILGSFYTYTYNTANPFAKKQWYFMGSIDVAGNMPGLLGGAKEPREKKLLGTPYAQFVKFDADVRYQKKLRNGFDWVSRFQVGIGIPYGNSNMLPFTKQYVIGGAGMLRGFTMRQVGPGSHRPTLQQQQFYQLIGGDYKLLVNSELRIPLVGRFSAATFVDIGNIWTKDTLLFGPAAKLSSDFYKELAVGAGAGIRIDVGLILLRLDVAIPLRKPFLPDGERWVLNKIALGSGNWRRDNLTLNIALGYPF